MIDPTTDELLSLYAGGWTLAGIAKQLGMTKTAVAAELRRAREAGDARSIREPVARRRISDDPIELMAVSRLYAAGDAPVTIAEKLGSTHVKIRRLVSIAADLGFLAAALTERERDGVEGPRIVSIVLRGSAAAELIEEAKERGSEPGALGRRVLEWVLRDDLVDAVLDEN